MVESVKLKGGVLPVGGFVVVGPFTRNTVSRGFSYLLFTGSASAAGPRSKQEYQRLPTGASRGSQMEPWDPRGGPKGSQLGPGRDSPDPRRVSKGPQ